MVTKQQQLEWLAGKYEKWPVSDEYVVMSGYDIGLFGGCYYITKEEWQQERDKMQKQMINIASVSVKLGGDNPDNSWHEQDGKVMSENEFEDELEKMYWDFDAERAKKAKCERLNFKMFMRIASGLRVERKQGNSWHERGELPPVGCECVWVDESGVDCPPGVKYPAVGDVVSVCAHRQTPGGDAIAIFTWAPGDGGLYVACSRMPSDFRPLRTEREKAIDEMVSVILDYDGYMMTSATAELVARQLHYAGYHK